MAVRKPPAKVTPARQLKALQDQIAIHKAQFELRRLQAFSSLGDASGYITPGSGRKSMRGWSPRPKNADADTLKKLPGLRGGSRDLTMNTPVAKAALGRMVSNAVGWGLTLQANIDREVLGLDEPAARAWERQAERHWRYWCYSQEADASRTLNFQSMQAVALFNTLLSGDCFVLLPYIERPGSPYRLKLKMLEADDVSNPDTSPEKTNFAAGIEYDEYGAPKAYHVRQVKPDEPIGTALSREWQRVEAFGKESGRRNVIHLMKYERIGQRRGVPFLAPVIERLKQISRLSESELAAAVIASYFAVFIKGPQPLAPSLPGEERLESDAQAERTGNIELGPGTVFELGEGQSGVEIADPKRPNGAFDPFFTAMVKEVGACLGIPFEVLMQHFSASYSASRAALLEAWKMFHETRHWLIEYLNDPVYEAFLEDIVSAGILKAPGFFEDWETRQAWLGCKWTGRGQGQINPLQETEAMLKRVGGLVSSYEDEVAAYSGERWDAVLVQRAREEQLKKDHKMTPQDLAPDLTGQAAPAGAPPSASDTPSPDDEEQQDDGDNEPQPSAPLGRTRKRKKE